MKTDEQLKKDDKETFPHVLASCCASFAQQKPPKKTIREGVNRLVINNSARVGQKKSNHCQLGGRNYENTPSFKGSFFLHFYKTLTQQLFAYNYDYDMQTESQCCFVM